MNGRLAILDWGVFLLYFAGLASIALIVGRRKVRTSQDYFLAGGKVPPVLAAVSVLATTQSAATFIGCPDYAYRGDFTYLSINLGALLGAFVVANVLMPRFYKQGAGTVYELLRLRFGPTAMRAAGGMFIVGRILAGGARLYLAAIALSVLMFNSSSSLGVCAAAAVVTLAAFGLAVYGGLGTIVWMDLLQWLAFAGAAMAILIVLLFKIDAPLPTLMSGLTHAPGGQDKLRLINFSWSLSAPFTLPAALTGFTLLSIGNFGLDQDTTQRLLACKDARSGSQGLYLSVFATIPVVAVFLAIGALLSVYYDRPDMTSHGARLARAGGAPAQRSDIAVLVRFILTETPPGIKGLATVGIAAAAMGTTMSALNAISSVLIQDFYRAWRSRRRWGREDDLVLAGRAGMAAAALMTLGMAVVSDLWRRATGAPLLEFVLSVMNFAYAGLLGVYFAAVFSNRGSSTSVIAALIGGFLVVLTLQPSLALALRAPSALTSLAFPWALCLGTITSFLICIVFDSRPRQSSIDPAQSHGRRSWSASP